MRRILSTLQFVNNHALLFGGARRAEIALFGVGWVQINAFWHALQKSDLISEDGLMHAYALLRLVCHHGVPLAHGQWSAQPCHRRGFADASLARSVQVSALALRARRRVCRF